MRMALNLITRFKKIVAAVSASTITFRTLLATAVGATSTTVALTSVSLTQHDGIIVWVSSNGNVSPTSVTDNAGGGSNTYTAVGTGVYNNNDDQTITQYFCKDAKATETVTVTVTWAASQTNRSISVLQCLGHDLTATPDGLVGPIQINNSTTDGITTTNITPSAAVGTLVAMTCNSHANAQAAGIGFNDLGGNFTNWASVCSLGTRAESLNYTTTAPIAALFTNQGDGLGRNITPGMAIKSA